MKISVARHDPLRFPHGEKPVGRHLCRQYSSVESSAMESLECPKEKQQLWWTRFGPDICTDSFPPDDRLLCNFTSVDAKLTEEQDIPFKPTLLSKLVAMESDLESHQQLLQVGPQSLQAQCRDYKESLHDQMAQGDVDMASKLSVSHSHADLLSLDEEPHSQSAVLISECHCEPQSVEDASESHAMARVKLMCSFGGRIMARPIDGKLRYVGGETRIVAVCKSVSFTEFMSKMSQVYGSPLGFKYQLPDEDLDALISVSSDDDLQNMMEECEKVVSSGCSASRLRLFFFSTPAEVEVADTRFEGEDGCSFPERRYVDAINGMSAKLPVSLPEDDPAGSRHLDPMSSNDASRKVPLIDQTNEITQCSVPSSSSSSPLASAQPSYHRPPGLTDISLPSLIENFGKVSVAPLGFEGNVDQDVSGSSSSTSFHHHYEHPQYDPQFPVAVDSPRITHTDASVSRHTENWVGMCRIDSQTKLARLSDHHSEYKTSVGGHSEHWHDVPYLRDATLPQGEHQRINQQHMSPLPSLQQPNHQQHPQHQHQHHPHQHHHHHHQQQQQQYLHHHHYQQQLVHQQHHCWYLQNDGDAGRGEHTQQEMQKQSQSHVIQHHQLPYHLHHNVSAHDGCSWSSDHHGMLRSTQINAQILHGMAPAPPYQMGSAPSSPRVGLYDYPGKCACGLQHSQVHRGITVSIGEHPYNRWLPTSHGDQAARKQTLRGSSRFHDNSSYCVDLPTRQQASRSLFAAEADHKEFASHRLQNHARYSGEFQSAEGQARNSTIQYCEPLVHNGEHLPMQDWADQSKCGLCINCIDNQRQQMEMAVDHAMPMEVSDQAPEWLYRRGYDLDKVSSVRKALPRISMQRNEEKSDGEERSCEVESEICGSQLLGDPDSRRALASHIESMHHSRKSQLSSAVVSGRFAVPDEALIPQPSSQRASDWPPKWTTMRTSSEVPSPWGIPPSEPRNWFDVPPSQQGQTSARMLEASMLGASNSFLGKDLPVMNLASGSYAVVEGGENSDGHALFSEAQHQSVSVATLPSLCVNGFAGAIGRARGETLGYQSVKSGIEFVDQGSNGTVSSGAHRIAHLLSPDVIPLGPGASTAATTLEMGNTDQTVASPIFDHSTFDSVHMTNFSFAAGKATLPSPEINFDKEPASLTAILADSITSSVLDCCSNDTLSWETSFVDQEATNTESEKVLKEGDNVSGKMDSKMISLDSNSMKLLGFEDGRGSSVTQSTNFGLEDVMDKASTPNGSLKVIVDGGAIQTVVTGGSIQNSCQDKVSEVGGLGMGETKEPSLSEAEAEAVARGLQIIKNADLEDMKELGSGTYGTVYHGKWRGSDVAIKRIKATCFTGPLSDRERLIADFWKEACTLGQLHHPNVVAFYGIVPDGPGGTLATVTEYMVNGSLKQVLQKKDRTIDRRKRLFIAMDAAFGMEYLHSKNIVHFDLKCENLLVNMRDAHRPICKVGDFGLSKVKHHTLVSGGVRGTLPWMAPELLSGNSSMVSEKIDVFSFGIVMWELLTGEEPYANMHCGAIIGGIVNDTLRPTIPSWCDPGWRSLMERCWSGNPAERPAFAEVAKELRAIAATMNLK